VPKLQLQKRPASTYTGACIVTMVVISLGEADSAPESTPQGYLVAVDEEPAPLSMASSMNPQTQKPDREGTAASKADRELTTASRVSNMSREEIIEELEAVEAQLQNANEEKETWKSKFSQAESEFETLKREATEELESLKAQASEELDTWKSKSQRAEEDLAGLKKQLSPQLLGIPADEVEAFLRGSEPGKATKTMGRCLTDRKFIILMLYVNLVCGAIYLYVFTVHQATDEEFQPRPTWLLAADWAFLSIFVLAMVLRLLVFRLSLRGFWNVFEFALLPLFIIEQALSANADSIIDEMHFPRNTLQGLRIFFVIKLVPVLARECKSFRSKPEPAEPESEQTSQTPAPAAV